MLVHQIQSQLHTALSLKLLLSIDSRGLEISFSSCLLHLLNYVNNNNIYYVILLLFVLPFLSFTSNTRKNSVLIWSTNLHMYFTLQIISLFQSFNQSGPLSYSSHGNCFVLSNERGFFSNFYFCVSYWNKCNYEENKFPWQSFRVVV